MTILLEDEYGTVDLFVENLLWGRIKANFYRLVEHGESSQYNNEIKEKVYRWRYLRLIKNSTLEQDQEFYDLSHFLYCIYMDGRVDGTIEGELKDIDYEALQNENSKLKEENEHLKEDNRILAEEVIDKSHIIESYEKNEYKK